MSDDLPAIPWQAVPVATARQMAEVDRIASSDFGIALEALMESAACQVARLVRVWCGGALDGRDIVAMAGTGNNGGDALAAIRWLHGWGGGVRVVLSSPADRLKPLARRQLAALEQMRVEVIDGSSDLDAASRAVTRSDVLLDGLLGYSANGAPRGVIAQLIATSHDTRATIVAVDLPSGLDADSGATPGDAVRANLTVTLGLPKPGLAERTHVGTLFVADIGIPPEVFARVGIDTAFLFRRGDLLRIAP